MNVKKMYELYYRDLFVKGFLTSRLEGLLNVFGYDAAKEIFPDLTPELAKEYMQLNDPDSQYEFFSNHLALFENCNSYEEAKAAAIQRIKKEEFDQDVNEIVEKFYSIAEATEAHGQNGDLVLPLLKDGNRENNDPVIVKFEYSCRQALLDEMENMPDAGNTVANDIVKTWKDGSVLKYRKNDSILIFNDTANWNIYKISYIDTSVPWICFVYHEKNTYEKIVNVQTDAHKRIIPNDTSEFILLH